MSRGGHWAPLLPTAMVGTERQPMPAAAWQGEVGALLSAVAASAADAPIQMLRMAAVIATCAQAGARGAPVDEPAPAAQAETLDPPCEPALLRLMPWTLAEGPWRLQHELVSTLRELRWRLPHALLPKALDLGRRSVAIRAHLVPVLGERGLWLATQNPDWAFAAGVGSDAGGDATWTDGSPEQRREFLRRERRRDPEAARGRLQQSLAELPAKERAELVPVLAECLSLEDEALLDLLRADRSKEVRQAATALLLALPDAAATRRAVSRVEALMKHERVLLMKKWTIDAPAEIQAEWKADNVEAARPQHESLGERAWWLYQLVRQVPLAWWTTYTGMGPAALLAWAKGTDWAEALVRGWRDVLFATPDDAWCEALLDDWPQKLLRDDPAAVLALLPLPRRERHWEQQLRHGNAALNMLLPRILAACPAGDTLSEGLTATLAQQLRQRAESRALDHDYNLRGALAEACCILHVSALERLADLPRHAEETPSHAQALHAAEQVIAMRRTLHATRTSRTP